MLTSTAFAPSVSGNVFLDHLPHQSATLLRARLVPTTVRSGQPVAEPGFPLKHVIFPIACVVSTVTRMQDGADVEVSMTGREGLYGVRVALGDDTTGMAALAAVGGPMLQMTTGDFRACLQADPQLTERVLNYALATLEIGEQLSGCNRLHPINERLARWLLMAHDRTGGEELPLTHARLAALLGVRRPGVSLAASALDHAGIITSRHGRVLVLDRAGLEAFACECYPAVNAVIERLLGYGIQRRPSPANA